MLDIFNLKWHVKENLEDFKNEKRHFTWTPLKPPP